MALGTKRKATNTLAQFPVNFPSGTVVPFAGATAPEGWALCNGDAVSRTEYASLFSAIGDAWGVGDGSTTFNLPDMRGQFLRGKNNGRDDGNQDPDGERALGNFQNDAIRNITGSFAMRGTTGGFDTFVGAFEGNGANSSYLTSPGGSGGAQAVLDVSNVVPTGLDNRPKNVAVNYIIKL